MLTPIPPVRLGVLQPVQWVPARNECDDSQVMHVMHADKAPVKDDHERLINEH